MRVGCVSPRRRTCACMCGNVNSPRLSSADVIIRGVGLECDFWSMQYVAGNGRIRLREWIVCRETESEESYSK